MKDAVQKIVVGVVLAVFGALLGIYITNQRQPNLQLLIDQPLVLATERITVFRLKNFGGSVANGAEVRITPLVGRASLTLITKSPSASVSDNPVVLTAEKIKPNDSVEFFIRDGVESAKSPKDFIVSAVYDQGVVAITSLDERLEKYVAQKQLLSFAYGAFSGVVFLALIVIAIGWMESRNKVKSISAAVAKGDQES